MGTTNAKLKSGNNWVVEFSEKILWNNTEKATETFFTGVFEFGLCYGSGLLSCTVDIKWASVEFTSNIL